MYVFGLKRIVTQLVILRVGIDWSCLPRSRSEMSLFKWRYSSIVIRHYNMAYIRIVSEAILYQQIILIYLYWFTQNYFLCKSLIMLNWKDVSLSSNFKYHAIAYCECLILDLDKCIVFVLCFRSPYINNCLEIRRI